MRVLIIGSALSVGILSLLAGHSGVNVVDRGSSPRYESVETETEWGIYSELGIMPDKVRFTLNSPGTTLVSGAAFKTGTALFQPTPKSDYAGAATSSLYWAVQACGDRAISHITWSTDN